MSHTSHCDATVARRTVTDRHVWVFMTRIDEDLAAQAAARPCPHCGVGRLHRADYPRASWGLSRALRENAHRFSLCCNKEGCRKRVRPDSVRYFGRRVYVASVFLLVSALLHCARPRLDRLCTTFSIDRRTLKRWRRWWKEMFPQSDFWCEHRFELLVAPEQAPLVGLCRDGKRRRRCGFTILGVLYRFPDLARAAG